MQISSTGTHQLQQLYSQLSSQSVQQQANPSQTTASKDHDGDVDRPGSPDVDGKGKRVDLRA
ncbi:hypothetical protein LSG31_14075 [Fodinisporobacter ferrooxydans]|uniref:Uncharacterized protein n=1 Tax=Fodinisporobacter ferrooxydans TaxID=2901836 RepID=A0ABY4CEU4_9BACL|nr:hypothetical protein LSG31_14075 [Alicyclobacillaceae bacterium MYW30-H2]